MDEISISITPATRVGELLENFPQLEDTLISLSPSFAKLRNPVLRRTIARVATLQQIALVGNVPIETIINTLRKEAGQNQYSDTMENTGPVSNSPEWFNPAAISESLDAREMLQRGEHPLAEVLARTSKLKQGAIFELITPFLPAPLIGKVEASGLESYTVNMHESEFRTYFFKP